jgi:hypothetical protein
MRLTETRFLSSMRQRDFRYFLKTQIGDLKVDENVDKMVALCFSKKNVPGLEGAFWRFENIDVADNDELKREISRKIKESDRSLGVIARVFLEEITRFGGCERPCVKFPVDVGHVPQLVDWFPECKIVHVTRDPRAIAVSKTNDPSGTAIKVLRHPRLAWLIRKLSVWSVIVQYGRTARFHRRFRQLRNYRLFRYEDLLVDPERTLRDLCQFVGVEFTRDLLHPETGIHLHQPSSLTGRQEKAFDPSAGVRWKDVISSFEKWLITALTKRSMKILDYDPETHLIFRVGKPVVPRLCQEVAQ